MNAYSSPQRTPASENGGLSDESKAMLRDMYAKFQWLGSFNNYLDNLSEEEFDEAIGKAKQTARKKDCIDMVEIQPNIFEMRPPTIKITKR